MSTIKSLLTTSLLLLLLSSISLADTFVVTNLNDPGAGSLRQSIINSNLNPGPDEIVFEEGLSGTIFLNVGPMSIQDDLTIKGPGAERITIDADGKSSIFDVNDFDNGINRVVEISGLRLINADDVFGLVGNIEILTVKSCEFINGKAEIGGAILNFNILTVDSCLFENNSSDGFGGAIFSGDIGTNIETILSITNSEFRDNQALIGGAIKNLGIIEIIDNSVFVENKANLTEFSGGGAISNEGTIKVIINSTFDGNFSNTWAGAIENLQAALIQTISNCTFNENSSGEGGALLNASGVINEIRNSTFKNNIASIQGGAIINIDGLIETIVNSTLNNNISPIGAAIFNLDIINISFTTIAGNEAIGVVGDGVVATGQSAISRIRNSILAFNSPDSCFGVLDDFGGNYSDDFSCGFAGDGSVIFLGPLADNGGPTETMDLLGGDPEDGATPNCDALDENGNPTGIPIGFDQRYFPRPFGFGCDSGAFENSPSATVSITKVTDPGGGSNFRFTSSGFNPRQECPLGGGGDGVFVLSDGQSISCNVPQGSYSINEIIPQGYELVIFCLEAPDNIVINNETGDINFTIEDASSTVDCIYTNIKKGSGGGGGCAIAGSGSNNNSFVLLFLIPTLVILRRFVRKYRFRF